MPQGNSVDFMLRLEGVVRGSTWQCYCQAGDEKPIALIDIQNVDGGKIDFDVYPKDHASLDNRASEIRELDQLDAYDFLARIFSDTLIKSN